jgi:hypothetical protein
VLSLGLVTEVADEANQEQSPDSHKASNSKVIQPFILRRRFNYSLISHIGKHISQQWPSYQVEIFMLKLHIMQVVLSILGLPDITQLEQLLRFLPLTLELEKLSPAKEEEAGDKPKVEKSDFISGPAFH